MNTPKPPEALAAERERAARRRSRRIALGAAAAVVVVAAGASAVVLRDGSESDGTDTVAGRSATTDTAAGVTAPDDPTACLHGTYRLASQVFSGPVETAFGRAELEGGKAGRAIELLPDGMFRFSDTGEASTHFTLLDSEPPVSGEATLVVEATGTYTADADMVTVDVTGLTGTLTAVTDDGEELPVPLPPDGAGVEATFGFTPNAQYACDDDTVTVDFQALTLVLERR